MAKLKGFFEKITGRRLFVILLAILIGAGAITSACLYHINAGYQAAKDEYAELRSISLVVMAPRGSGGIDMDPTPDVDLREINPSYVFWLKINGTEIDYPVVQGKDNEYYMFRTFRGEKNAAGTPFMDIRCPGGLEAPLAIVYGHNMHDGSMFAALHSYRNSTYFLDHSDITVTPYEGKPLTYRIFAVLLTDVYDEIFELRGGSRQDIFSYCAGLGKPSGSGGVLVLSTCTTGGSDNERLLVFSAEI